MSDNIYYEIEEKKNRTNWRFLFKPISILQLAIHIIAFVLLIVFMFEIVRILNLNNIPVNTFQVILFVLVNCLLIASNLYGISAIFNY